LATVEWEELRRSALLLYLGIGPEFDISVAESGTRMEKQKGSERLRKITCTQ